MAAWGNYDIPTHGLTVRCSASELPGHILEGYIGAAPIPLAWKASIPAVIRIPRMITVLVTILLFHFS